MAKTTFSKLLKFNYKLSPITQNCFVLYFFLLLAIVEILYLVRTNDIISLTTLLIVGFLTTFFNKNMVVVLFLALVITNLLKYGVGSRINEGFEGREENKDEKAEDKKEKDGEDKNKEDEKKTSETVEEQYENLKEEYPRFKVVQQEILAGVQKMTPLLEKAEKFIDKFDTYKTHKTKESFSKHAK